ncbi:hypothetical protein OSU_1406 [Vibrio cholerae PS15]|nr:hypothetical protein OSU_1406 [Vibrio cholerae PS15]
MTSTLWLFVSEVKAVGLNQVFLSQTTLEKVEFSNHCC